MKRISIYSLCVFVLGGLSALYGYTFDLNNGWAKDPADNVCKYRLLNIPVSAGCSPTYTGPTCTVKFGAVSVDAYNNAANCETQAITGILYSNIF